MRSEMCSLHLTHPSAHTPGAVGSRLCGAQGAVFGVSVPCPRVSPQSWTLPARAGIQTHNLGLLQVSSPTLFPLGHDCPNCFRINPRHGLVRDLNPLTPKARIIPLHQRAWLQIVHSLLCIVAKCNFFSVVTWKDITKNYMWGVYSLLWDTVYIYIYIYIYCYYTKYYILLGK